MNHLKHAAMRKGDSQMQTVANHFTPLALETRSAIPTDEAAHHLNRQPQTMRAWACLENSPIHPVRINGRLAWPVAAIRALLSGGGK